VIAVKAAADYVVPGFSASFGSRDYMVEGEIFSRAFFPAILTGVVISGVNVGPAKFDMMEASPHLYVLEEPEHAGKLDGKTDASNLAVVLG
jgi:hypothetical protein